MKSKVTALSGLMQRNICLGQKANGSEQQDGLKV